MTTIQRLLQLAIKVGGTFLKTAKNNELWPMCRVHKDVKFLHRALMSWAEATGLKERSPKGLKFSSKRYALIARG